MRDSAWWKADLEQAGQEAPRRPLVRFLRRLTWPLFRPHFHYVLDRLAEDDARRASGGAAPSYAQCGEDRILAFVLERLGLSGPEIAYADIGAATPDAHNNTYLLYRQGARGLLVEADPAYGEAYRNLRPGDEVLPAAVVPERLRGTGTIEFHLSGDRGWNSVLREHVDEAERRGKGEARGAVAVPARTINEALASFRGRPLHVLSIDAEGVDAELVAELDLSAVRPWIVVVEDAGAGRLDGVLRGRGYEPYASTYVNAIYLDRPVLERLKERF